MASKTFSLLHCCICVCLQLFSLSKDNTTSVFRNVKKQLKLAEKTGQTTLLLQSKCYYSAFNLSIYDRFT